MQDYQGHVLQHRQVRWKPRSGQWVLFRLLDIQKQYNLIQLGAHSANDGSLVAIFQAAHVSSLMQVKRANGRTELAPPEHIPDRLMLVDSNGNNLAHGLRNPATGHVEVKDIIFFLDSPGIHDLRPLENIEDLPPGRKIDPAWKPRG